MNKSPSEQIESAAENIWKEFMGLAKHEDLYEILCGFWLYDDSYPTPSKEFIVFLSNIILRDNGMLDRLDSMTRDEGLKHIAVKIVSTSEKPEILRKIASEEGFRQYAAALMFGTDPVSKNCANWWGLMCSFCYPKTTTERIVAQYFIEHLTSHSLFNYDRHMILALAEVRGILYKDSHPENTTSRTISHEVYYFHSYLRIKLGRLPSKAEMKSFIQGVRPQLDGRDKSWKTVLRDCPLKFRDARSGERNANVIARLGSEWNL